MLVPRPRLMVRLTTSVALLALTGAPQLLFGAGAARDLSGYTGPDMPFTVTITLDLPPGTDVVGAEDGPPPGWTAITNITEGGTYDADSHKVKWGPFFSPSIPTTLSYDVTPPPSEACFAGTANIDGIEHTIGGNACVPVAVPAVSAWGTIALLLSVLIAAVVVFRSNRKPA